MSELSISAVNIQECLSRSARVDFRIWGPIGEVVQERKRAAQKYLESHSESDKEAYFKIIEWHNNKLKELLFIF